MSRVRLRRCIGTAVVASGLIFAVGACSAANESSSANAAGGLTGTLDGAGASSQQAAMEAWQSGFLVDNPDATVNYDPVGSGAGREQFIAGAVPLAGSDAFLETAELNAAKQQCGPGHAVDVPVYISPIAVVFNLKGVDDLQLSAQTVAGIFNGDVTSWDDPEIAADNPGTTLPNERITAVHRADESGTTENFVDYLSQAAPGQWTHEVSDTWPVRNGEAAQGTSGVVAAVRNGQGTIGYADASQAAGLGVAAIKVGQDYVPASARGAAALVDASSEASGRPAGDLAFNLDRTTTEPGVYPITLVSYQVACTSYRTQHEADLVKAFLTYVVGPKGQRAAADHAGSAPISGDLRRQVQTSIDMIKAQG